MNRVPRAAGDRQSCRVFLPLAPNGIGDAKPGIPLKRTWGFHTQITVFARHSAPYIFAVDRVRSWAVFTYVLIVDDSHVTRAAIRARLEHEPGLVICGEAADGIDAIRQASTCRPDLVLLDLAMPKLNGAETAVALKRMMPKVHIFLFTLFAENANDLAPRLGVDAVLAKHEGMHELVHRIRKFLDSENHRTASAN